MKRRLSLGALRWIAFAVPGGVLSLFLLILRTLVPQYHWSWWGFVVEAGGILLGAFLFSTFVFDLLKKGEADILRSNSQLQALHEASLSITGDLSLEAVLQTLVDQARELAGARYCALRVLPEGGQGPSRFLVAGMPPEAGARKHNSLEVPILSRGRVLGDLYLTGKQGAPEFSADDLEVVTRLANQAAAAITNARLYQEARRASERLERLIQGSQDAIVVLDPTGRVELWNRGAETLYGLSSDQARLEVLPFLPPEAQPEFLEHLREISKPGSVLGMESVHRRGKSGQVPVLVSLSPVPAFEGEPARILMITKDMTAQRRLEAQRRRLALFEERERIGMDLHDGAIQALYAVGLGLEAVRRQLPPTLTETAEGLAGAKNDLNRVIQDLRAYILDHRQRGLAARTLAEEAQDLAGRLRDEGRLQVDADISVESEPPAEVTGHLLYILKEAVSNVLRHSEASAAQIEVRVSGGQAVIVVRDNGRGYDPVPASMHGRLGLRNMRARARLLGGECSIQSSPGAGTEVRVDVPVEGGGDL